MASPSIVGTPTESNVTADDTTPFTVSRPAGVSSQLTIVVIAIDGQPTLTWPSGYTQFFTQSRAGGFTIYGAYHREDGTEGATFDITSSASEKWAAIVYSLSGAADPATRTPEATTVDGSTATLNPDPPAITPTGGSKDYLFIACIAQDGEEADDDTWANTSPTNYTPSPPRQKTTGITGLATTNTSLCTAERALTAASDDPGTFNVDQSLTYVGATIAVHPSPPVVVLDGSISTTGLITGAIDLGLALDGTVTATGAAGGVIDQALTLIAATDGSGLVAGDLIQALSLDGSLSASGSLAADAALEVGFLADIAGSGLIAGALDVSQPIVILDASIATSGALDGNLGVALMLMAEIQASAGMIAEIEGPPAWLITQIGVYR